MNKALCERMACKTADNIMGGLSVEMGAERENKAEMTSVSSMKGWG